MRRRPVVVTRRGPGIVGTMARTAVVAGTATATVKAVSGGMDSHAYAQQQAAQQQEAAYASAQQSQAQMEQMQGQMNQMQAQMNQQPSVAALPQTAPSADLTTQLQNLAQLKASGALSDAEYQAAKAKLLGS